MQVHQSTSRTMRLARQRKWLMWVFLSLTATCIFYWWRLTSRTLMLRIPGSASSLFQLGRLGQEESRIAQDEDGRPAYANRMHLESRNRKTRSDLITRTVKDSAIPTPFLEAHRTSFRRMSSSDGTSIATPNKSIPISSADGDRIQADQAGQEGIYGTNINTHIPLVAAQNINKISKTVKTNQRETEFGDIDPRLTMPRLSYSNGPIKRKQCTEHSHIVFLKVHKTGSSTVANILQRYGFQRHLNFVLPNQPIHTNGYNYISKPGENFTSDSILPPPLGQSYDILWNHVIYNRDVLNTIMPPDTVYVTMLREPFQQFVSAFTFYKKAEVNVSFLTGNPYSYYLHNDTHVRLLNYFRNKQAQDLGMTTEHAQNEAALQRHLRQLNEDFNLVMITEYFDESLVLLRRLMCWSLKDVLYVPINKNVNKTSPVFSEQDYAKHRHLSALDYELYGFFKRKFLRTLIAQDVDFEHELKHFREVLLRVQFFCGHERQSQHMEPRSAWNEEIVVTERDCKLIALRELKFLDLLLSRRFENGDLHLTVET